MGNQCVKCKIKLVDGDGRYNLPTGTECIKCHDHDEPEPKFVNIAGINVPYKKLKQYVEVVEYTRRAALMGQTRDDPLIVMRVLENRVKIHKEIFKMVGIEVMQLMRQLT